MFHNSSLQMNLNSLWYYNGIFVKMGEGWFPENKAELEKLLNEFLVGKAKKGVNGVIVPHAGHVYSGAVAGKAFSLLGNKFERAIVVGPSHYVALNDAVGSDKKELETPLGKIKVFNEGFSTASIEKEHSITNQIPFLQKLGVKEIMPLMVGQITFEQACEIAEKISKIDAAYVFSTDLSHFLSYEEAVSRDKETIKIIESLDVGKFDKVDACGFFPLLILMHLCKLKKWKVRLAEYKNSGDVIGDKSRVVGYGSFWF
jgi:MEMO1 family protein